MYYNTYYIIGVAPSRHVGYRFNKNIVYNHSLSQSNAVSIIIGLTPRNGLFKTVFLLWMKT